VPDLSERLREADDATKRALFDAFDLRVVYDKDGDRLSVSATLTETVASMLHNGLEPLWQSHSGGGTRTHNLSINSRAHLPVELPRIGLPRSAPGTLDAF
jgi:hypothetical protein